MANNLLFGDKYKTPAIYLNGSLWEKQHLQFEYFPFSREFHLRSQNI